MMPEEAVYDYVVRSMIGKILNTMDSDKSYDIACKKKSLLENINKARASILKETRKHSANVIIINRRNSLQLMLKSNDYVSSMASLNDFGYRLLFCDDLEDQVLVGYNPFLTKQASLDEGCLFFCSNSTDLTQNVTLSKDHEFEQVSAKYSIGVIGPRVSYRRILLHD